MRANTETGLCLTHARLPTVMDPKPVRRIAADGGFEGAVDVEHDRFRCTRLTPLVRGDFLAEIDVPAAQREAVTNSRKNPATITQRQQRRRGTGGTTVAEKREPQPFVASVLIRQQTEDEAAPIQRRPQCSAIRAPLEIKTTRFFAQRLHQPVQRGLAQRAVGGRELKGRRRLGAPGVEFEITKMADGHDTAPGRFVSRPRAGKFFRAGDLEDPFQVAVAHASGFYRATVAFPQAPEMFLRQGLNFSRRLFRSKTEVQISQRDTPMPGIEPPGDRSAGPAEARHDGQWQRPEHGEHDAREAVKQRVHRAEQEFKALTETDLLDAVVKIFGAAQDFDLDPHEIDGQIASVELGKPDGVLLRGDNGVRLAFFAAVDHVQYLLLAEPVMIGEAL